MLPTMLLTGLLVGWLAAVGWWRLSRIVAIVVLAVWMVALASGLDSFGDYAGAVGLAVANLAVGAVFAAVFTRILGRAVAPRA